MTSTIKLPAPTHMAVVSTIKNNRSSLRPMTMINQNGRLYFATGSQDAKVAQIKANPQVECLVLQSDARGNGYFRIAGNLEIITDLSVKKSVADFAPFIYQYWKDASDADYVLYELFVDSCRYLDPGANWETRV
ncbi:MAG: pyridoxamine 5'-phosphate oxidase family protein [Candidatus Cloacimonetes bacterium]|nr:pyridoxamine 5'-phosphate oxidase family protein [Candidatus Cloacimonadota bacterium]MDD2506111.1 pyridoxamine 5'-phosphate oxidase family protein [Candidatus Cloacimonadota bacterium]MDD4559740.1 pyridoxamine 5'-phosphate oxidase family protein [Candidatus Cloacimonadota bacterium]